MVELFHHNDALHILSTLAIVYFRDPTSAEFHLFHPMPHVHRHIYFSKIVQRNEHLLAHWTFTSPPLLSQCYRANSLSLFLSLSFPIHSFIGVGFMCLHAVCLSTATSRFHDHENRSPGFSKGNVIQRRSSTWQVFSFDRNRSGKMNRTNGERIITHNTEKIVFSFIVVVHHCTHYTHQWLCDYYGCKVCTLPTNCSTQCKQFRSLRFLAGWTICLAVIQFARLLARARVHIAFVRWSAPGARLPHSVVLGTHRTQSQPYLFKIISVQLIFFSFFSFNGKMGCAAMSFRK